MDLITYISDMSAFRLEIKAKAEKGEKPFSLDNNGSVSYSVAKIPVTYSDDMGSSVCLIRLTNEDELTAFEKINSIEKIGECINSQYVFVDGGKEKYNTVYNQATVTITDNYSGERTYTPPEMIGLFA